MIFNAPPNPLLETRTIRPLVLGKDDDMGIVVTGVMFSVSVISFKASGVIPVTTIFRADVSVSTAGAVSVEAISIDTGSGAEISPWLMICVRLESETLRVNRADVSRTGGALSVLIILPPVIVSSVFGASWARPVLRPVDILSWFRTVKVLSWLSADLV